MKILVLFTLLPILLFARVLKSERINTDLNPLPCSAYCFQKKYNIDSQTAILHLYGPFPVSISQPMRSQGPYVTVAANTQSQLDQIVVSLEGLKLSIEVKDFSKKLRTLEKDLKMPFNTLTNSSANKTFQSWQFFQRYRSISILVRSRNFSIFNASYSLSVASTISEQMSAIYLQDQSSFRVSKLTSPTTFFHIVQSEAIIFNISSSTVVANCSNNSILNISQGSIKGFSASSQNSSKILLKFVKVQNGRLVAKNGSQISTPIMEKVGLNATQNSSIEIFLGPNLKTIGQDLYTDDSSSVVFHRGQKTFRYSGKKKP